MEHIARLHYAYRSLLLLLDHLQTFRLVKAECSLLPCCHVAELRVITTASRQLPNSCLHAVVLRVRAPNVLRTIMKSTTVTRCTIANEILRRRKQIEHDNRHPHNHPEYSADLISISIEDIPPTRTRSERRTEPSELSTADEQGIVEPGSIHTSALNNTSAPSAQRRKSSMWRPGLFANQQNSAIFAALQREVAGSARITQSIQSAPYERLSGSTQNECPDSQEEVQKRVGTPQPRAHLLNEKDLLDTTFRFPPTENTFSNHEQHSINSESNPPRAYPEAPRDYTSPVSDITLFEEPVICSLTQLKGGDGHQSYVSCEGAEQHSENDEASPTPVPRRRVRQQHELPINPALSAAHSPSIPLRARAKTNEGMLQLWANSSKEPTTIVPAHRHRHKLSLNLPVITSIRRPDGIQQSELTPGRTKSPRSTRTRDAISTLMLAERELEYKHRRIFIGTASLDDLLELLEVSPEHTTTKYAVAKAFMILSSDEQLYARQCSRRPEGWELVSRVTLDLTDTDYVAQSQIKLGSITLRQFLNLIPFDEEEVEALRVIEAFSAASHMDVKASVGTGSKARAFRSWMVSLEHTER
ncbi:uncharacterized protein K460DRAFT_288712 [Cucurbitaria berberidis CBS 394.84]|uniref:Uncharacterized protein n=1 Tax=Cucurbitaria berberidis CBS 394.84 TaxID=1168544 RepID=A0A9P4GEJ1_9PLEO|nr:uncharacterized protein K460DRAFT_288712 [Cucurbitaria berberidis CBS 394.84]KAF1844157.1 hypothetical protein K460DRAFT_288712 [Cucurbitaria berberidis CBS 394.84]